ncbi:MAG: choice-of-anchor J domain-containing protein [Bacteroidales bacterium]|nr:choice-of-anchor J domain-containing protein [Bacteroidales bacterium]
MKASLSLSNTGRRSRIALLPLLLGILLCIGVGQKAWGQETLTVNGNNTTTNSYVPIYGYWADSQSKCEFIIPSGMISEMAGSNISAMKFYLSSSSSYNQISATFNVFVKEVSQTTLTGYTGSTGATTVFNQTITINTSASNVEYNIPFSSDFAYQGGNLLIGFYQTGSTSYNYTYWVGESQSTNTAWYGYGSNTGSASQFLPKITFTYTPDQASCPKPRDLAASNIAPTSATISWTGNDNANSYEVMYGELVQNGVSNATYNFENGNFGISTPFTYSNDASYPWTVTSSGQSGYSGNYCIMSGNGGVGSSTSSFSITANFLEDGSISFRGGCWGEGTSWDVCTFDIDGSQQFSNGALQTWSTYTYNVTAGTHTFTWSYSKDGSVNPTGDAFYVDDIEFTGLFGGEPTFEQLGSYTAQSIPYLLQGLTPETTYNVYVRSNCSGNEQSDWVGPISFTTLESCPAPTNLTATATEHEATVTWTAGHSESNWILEYSTSSDFSGFTTENLSSPSYHFTCLPMGATYYVRVKADCGGGDESTWVTTSFSTSGAITCTTVGTGTSYTTSYGPVNDYWNYGYRQIIYPAASIGASGTISSIAFQYQYSTAMSRKNNVTIYMGHTSLSTFSSSTDWININSLEPVYSGPMNCSQGWNTFTLNTPFNYNGTDNLVMAILDNSGSYDGSYYAFYYSTGSGTVQLYLQNDDSPYNPNSPGSGSTSSYYPNTQFCIETATCSKPSDLTAEPDKHTADLTWTETGDANAWQICLNGDENNLIDVTSTSYTLTGLDAETQYNVKVRSICGDCDMSQWTSLNFTTLDACARPTNVTATQVMPTSVTLEWEGTETGRVRYGQLGSISFFEDFENGLGNFTTIDNDGDGYNWHTYSGNTDNYGNPTSLDYQHVTSASYDGYALTPDNWLVSPLVELGGSLSVWLRGQDPEWAAEHFAIYLSTSGNTVSDFLAGTVLVAETPAQAVYTEYTANLGNWSGQQGYIAIRHFNVTDMFRLNVDNFTIYGVGNWSEPVEATTNPFTLTGLDPETEYVIQVQNYCDDEEEYSGWSGVGITTPDNCATPYNVEIADITAHEATVSWTGIHETYDLQYASCTAQEYKYDDGIKTGDFYFSDEWYHWAVMFPANTYSGNFLTTISAYDNGPMNGTVAVYYGSLYEPNSLLGIMDVTFTGANQFVDFTFPEPLAINPSQNLWVVFGMQSCPYNSYPTAISATAAQQANASWYKTSSNEWIDYETAGGWMIHAHLLNADEFTTLSDVTSPQTLEELDSYTNYILRVRGNTNDCQDGHTDWSALTSFATTPACFPPTSVTVSDVTGGSAIVTWEGTSDEYNLIYRAANFEDAIYGAESPVTLCNLQAGTTYIVELQGDCGAEGLSPQLATAQFTTGNTAVTFSAGAITEDTYVPCGDFTSSQTIGSDEVTVEVPITEPVTIGDGTTTYYYYPINMYFNYSVTQELYTPAEIGSACTINSVSFYYDYSSSFSCSGVQMYMKHVNKTSFDNNTDMVQVYPSEKVWEGTMSASTAGWVTITLDEPFEYDGTSNLLLCMYDPTSGYPGSSYKFRTTATSNYSGIHWYSDSYTPDINDLTSFSGSKSYTQYRVNTQFGISGTGTATQIGSATGNEVEYQWKLDNEPIAGANGENYIITGAEMEALTPSLHTYTRWVKDLCNDWTQSEGEYTLDLRVPGAPQITEMPSGLFCGDQATLNVSSDNSSNMQLMYFWYDEYPISNNIQPIAHSGEQYTTDPMALGTNTLYVQAVTYRVENDIDTVWQCFSDPTEVILEAAPFEATAIAEIMPNTCGNYFTLQIDGNPAPNHTYVWYSDADCTHEVGRGNSYTLEDRQTETATYYMREYAWELEGGSYLCQSSNTASVEVTVLPLEAPYTLDGSYELCKGQPLNIAAFGEANDEQGLLDPYIVWFTSNDATEWIDTTASGSPLSRQIADVSTTLYAATASYIDSYSGPMTLSAPAATQTNYGNAVYFDITAGNSPVVLDSIDLQVVSGQGTGIQEKVYYHSGSLDIANTTDASSWNLMITTMDYDGGDHAIIHFSDPIRLEPNETISLLINTSNAMQLYYNVETQIQPGDVLANNNFMTMRKGYGFQYTSDFQEGFPTSSPDARSFCGTIHFDVEGELHFGCMSDRTPVAVIVDSVPEVSAITGELDPLCNGESLNADVLAELVPEISWNTADEQSQTTQWMVSVDEEDAVELNDNTNIFYYNHYYTLIYSATNNCGTDETSIDVEVHDAPAFDNNDLEIEEEQCINSPIAVTMPGFEDHGSDVTGSWEYASAFDVTPDEAEFEPLNIQEGITATGDYYIRGYIENDCGGDYTAIAMVSVFDKPVIAPIEDKDLGICFGANINPEVPYVDEDEYIAATAEGWLKVQDDEEADPVELTFPQTADMDWNDVRICYFATNDCGTTYSDTITLTVHPDIALTVRHDLTAPYICPAVGVELTASTPIADATFEWSNDDEGGLVSTTGNPVAAKNGSEDVDHYYTVVATDGFGCRDTATTTVAVVFHNDLVYDTVEICELELPYTYVYGDQDTTLQRAGSHIVKFPQADGCDYVVNLTLATREVTIIDYHANLCSDGDTYYWDAVEGMERTYTEAASDTIHIYYTGSQCDSILHCINVTQGEPSLVITDPQLSGFTGEALSTTVFGRTECDNNLKVAIEYDLYKDGEMVNPDDYGTLNFTTAIPDLNLSFGRNVHAATGSIPASTFNMYNYQYGYFYLGFFGTAPNTVTATWNQPGEYKIVFRVVGRTGGMDYPYQSSPGVVIGGGGGTTTSVYATDSLIMYVSGEGGNEGQEADVNNGQNGMITISAVQDNPVIGATSTFAVNIENPAEADPQTKVALDYEVYRDGQLLSELNGYGTMTFATFYDRTNAMVGNALEFPDGSVPEASFRVGFYSYGYFTLGFWSQTDNEFTANWQQPGEYKVVFRLVERTGGTPYPLTYGTNPNDTVGGANGSNTGTVLDTNAVIFYIPVAEPAEAVIDTIVCENDLPVMIHGTEFSDDAQEDLHVYSDNGVYDTIYHLTLTVAPAYTAENPVELDTVVCAGAFPFEWNGITFEEAGSQTANLQTVLGCDSVVSMTVTVDQPAHAAYTETACGSYEWNGTLYTESGDYEYSYDNDYGCTVTDTLHLTVHDVTTTPDVVAVCGSYEWNGETYYESGTYTYEHEVEYDNDVCTVTDTLVLTINTPLGTADTVEACGSYEWNGETYTASGTYYFDYEDADLNAGECEHVDTLYLTIFEVTPLVETETGCNEFYWQAADQTYYESGTYTYDRENEFGCTVTDTLHLTISQPNGEVITVEACESYEWHDRPYTESGEYYYDYQDADVNGGACPHVDTLRLTISQPYGEVFTVEACGEYTWIDGEEPITQSGTYTHEYQEGETCPRIDTLVLTVNPVYAVEDELEISVTELPYTYADTTFELGTQSGVFTVHLLSTSGCDSIVTLTLTVSGGSEGDAFLTVENISDSEFEVVAFANQVDPTEKVAIAYSITKDGEPVNIVSHDCGGELNISTEFNGSFVGQNVSYGEGYIPGNTFRLSSHYHDYFYFHFLNGRTNRISHSFTEEGEYEITLTLMSRNGGTDIFVPYSTAGGIMLIGGEGSADGEVLATETITFTVGGGSNEPVNPAPMGVGDYGQMPDITLFPNPARDIVTLRTNVADADCTVTDMSGKVVLSATADQSSDLQINVSQWAAGVYFVNLRSNGTTVTKKLVITK